MNTVDAYGFKPMALCLFLIDEGPVEKHEIKN
jgi:hypothetical protein